MSWSPPFIRDGCCIAPAHPLHATAIRDASTDAAATFAIAAAAAAAAPVRSTRGRLLFLFTEASIAAAAPPFVPKSAGVARDCPSDQSRQALFYRGVVYVTCAIKCRSAYDILSHHDHRLW